jgi:methylenetetrahydrofolate dehydrogenase (NADP+) / methenyltetrahydrofolate cyclohydrolase
MGAMADAHLIDGKAIAAALRAEVARDVARLQADHGITPGLATVMVGEDPASEIYVRNKGRQTEQVGMNSFRHVLPETTTQDALLDLVDKLNKDPDVNGILVQLPLPDAIHVDTVIDHINPDKDVDGFHPINMGLLMSGREGLRPCTPLGCMMLLEYEMEDLAGRHAVVVGRSNIVGKPLAQMLLAAHCTVTIAHSRTQDLDAICRQADILVASVGRPEMIHGDWIKPGAVVIDVGINRMNGADGKLHLVGDVDFDAARKFARAITPVPGGVGPMTIACLLRNTVTAARRQHGVDIPQ